MDLKCKFDTYLERKKAVDKFYIYNLDGSKSDIPFDLETEEKVKIVEDIIQKSSDDLNYMWIWLNAFDLYKLNPEDKVKSFLNRLGSYILYNGKKIDDLDEKKFSNKEVELDLLELVELSHNKKHYDTNGILSGSYNDNETYERKNKNKIKKRKKTRYFKLKKLFFAPNKTINELYRLKNKDIYDEKYIKNKEKEIFSLFSDENEAKKEFDKWCNKFFNNIFNQPTFDVRPKTYKGWEGVISIDKPYNLKWCYVDALGGFNFKNKRYKIDCEKVKQYYDSYWFPQRGKNKVISMDNILCIEQDGQTHFWDMNIEKIENQYITQMTEG
jgi:hypothetical protein